jgi:hypothetical protein
MARLAMMLIGEIVFLRKVAVKLKVSILGVLSKGRPSK